MIVQSSEDVTKYYPSFLTMPDEKNNKLFYGVELECNTIPRSLSSMSFNYQRHYKAIINVERAIDGVAILKPDCAFEIVTVPATLRFHKEQLWNKFFSGPHEECVGGEGVGLHIHFSRDALTPLQLAKVICFYHEPCNERFLSAVAGRRVAHDVMWCKTMKFERSVVGASSLTNHKGGAIHISRRNNGKTAEVRIFQSVPTKQGLFQALEFVDAVNHYFLKHGNIDKPLGYAEFLNWFVEQDKKEEYPHLYINLLALGFIKANVIELKQTA